MHKICNQLQQPQHRPVDVSSNTQGLRAFFIFWMFALRCSSLCLWKHLTSLFYFDHFFLPCSPLCYHPLFLIPVFCQLWSGWNSEDQMDWDDQITLARQRSRCILENPALFRFDSSDCSSSAICCSLQLHVKDILLNITNLPVPAEHLVCTDSSSRG